MLIGRHESKIVYHRLFIPDPVYDAIRNDPAYSSVFVLKSPERDTHPYVSVMPAAEFRRQGLLVPQNISDAYETKIYMTPKTGKPRIYITEEFRQSADLGREVFVLGIMNYFEVWNPGKLEESLGQIKETCGSIRERMTVIEIAWDGRLKQPYDNPPAQSCQSPRDS